MAISGRRGEGLPGCPNKAEVRTRLWSHHVLPCWRPLPSVWSTNSLGVLVDCSTICGRARAADPLGRGGCTILDDSFSASLRPCRRRWTPA